MCREWSFVKAADLGSGNGTHSLPRDDRGQDPIINVAMARMATRGPGIGPFEIRTESRVSGREEPGLAQRLHYVRDSETSKRLV